MNGEIGDREQLVRGIKCEDSQIFAGLQIYHNCVGPHMGLDGKTPADLAGIDVRGKTQVDNVDTESNSEGFLSYKSHLISDSSCRCLEMNSID